MLQRNKGPRAAHISPKKGFFIHLVVFAMVTPVTWMIWYATGTKYPWPMLQTPVWALAVLVHGLAISIFKKPIHN